MRGWRTALAGLLMVGCGGIDNEADYELARAQAECSRIERCELGRFESEYRDEDDCIDDREDRIRDNDNDLDDNGCVYDPDQASFCVSRVRGMDCAEWAQSGNGAKACDLVWDCTEGR